MQPVRRKAECGGQLRHVPGTKYLHDIFTISIFAIDFLALSIFAANIFIV